jgi:hypothetical protein
MKLYCQAARYNVEIFPERVQANRKIQRLGNGLFPAKSGTSRKLPPVSLRVRRANIIAVLRGKYIGIPRAGI